MTHRLLIVSNRLPVTAHDVGDQIRLTDASGGLATGLRRYHERAAAVWIGWPGDVPGLTIDGRRRLDEQLRNQRIIPVYLSQDHVERYYHGFANRVVWPLFHYLIDRVPIDATGWDAYRRVNQLFADTIAREYRPGDTIWVHDYQLMLLPKLLRDRVPSARIGFFLHIPFPSSEVFRILPWRADVLRGLLGADLVGFHTFAYLRHFLASLLHVEGIEGEIDRVRLDNREIQLGVFPMGVDAVDFGERSQSPEVESELARIRNDAAGRQILLGIDRLDYTKGIPRRLSAVERLLDDRPELRDRIRYIQIAVPSREGVESYQRFRRQVEEGVGRINGKCGTVASAPVHYLHRSVTPTELVALFRAADVMVVTPLRDGMNLVAKEFVASRVDEDGVLVLSEFAGAAAELDGALTVNPYDIGAVSNALYRGMSMSADERRARMRRLRRRVIDHDVHTWADTFLDRLAPARLAPTPEPRSRPEQTVAMDLRRVQDDHALRLLVDYDGTLVPIVRDPELAAPDSGLLSLLAALTAVQKLQIDIVSGRPRETLERWLGHLPLGLWAEHGFWRRKSPDHEWQAVAEIPAGWLDRIEQILRQFVADTPGSRVERKTASLAWHYRRADREFGARQAHELRMLLGDILSNQPFEVMEGKKVIEVRLRGVSKALVARRVIRECDPSTQLVAIGDDRTDEDLFRALPSSSLTIGVGPRPTCARIRLHDYREVRRLLRSLDRRHSSAKGDSSPSSQISKIVLARRSHPRVAAS
jgi:trehalose 6-phosphate synthase/phosphatase